MYNKQKKALPSQANQKAVAARAKMNPNKSKMGVNKVQSVLPGNVKYKK